MKVYIIFFLTCLILSYFPTIGIGQTNTIDTKRLQEVISKIKNEKFEITTKTKNIPRFVKRELRKIDKVKFKIAKAGGNFNSSDVIDNKSWPNKRIIFLAYNEDVYVLLYEQGGISRNYYGRVIDHKKNSSDCIFTFIMPPHKDFEEFKYFVENEKWLKIVKEKSKCF